MIKTVNVLDLKRGDTVVIVAGHGKHRGDSADMGCIDVSDPAVFIPEHIGMMTTGAHSLPRADEYYVTFVGFGESRTHEDYYDVPAITDVVVLR